jgi:hypothetical protein
MDKTEHIACNCVSRAAIFVVQSVHDGDGLKLACDGCACRYPPAHIAAILRSTQLVPDGNGREGLTLHISYQLKDGSGRTQVDAAGLVIRPVLSFGPDVTPPVGAAAANNALPDCDVSTLGAASGIGECSIVVDRKYFPAVGVLAATVTMKVLVG